MADENQHQLYCNRCWQALELDGKHVVTPCQHLFCLPCIQEVLDGDSTCTQCASVLNRNGVKAVQLFQDVSKYRLSLCGQSPEVAMQTALTAINFYIQQKNMISMAKDQKSQRRLDKLLQECDQRLGAMHSAYQKGKSKLQAANQQIQELHQEKEELAAKYSQRSSQVKQLKEQVAALSRQLQQGPQGGGPGGGGGNSMGMMMMGPGGPHPGRSSSPNTMGGQVVTTLQRTHVFNMSAEATPPMQLAIAGRRSTGSLNGSGMQPALLGGSAADMSPSMALGIAPAMPGHMGGQGGSAAGTGSGRRQSLGGQGMMMAPMTAPKLPPAPLQLLRGGGGGGMFGGTQPLQPSQRHNMMQVGSPAGYGGMGTSL